MDVNLLLESPVAPLGSVKRHQQRGGAVLYQGVVQEMNVMMAIKPNMTARDLQQWVEEYCHRKMQELAKEPIHKPSSFESPRPTEPSSIITAFWQTSAEETYIVKVSYAERIFIYGDKVNVIKIYQKDWEHEVPPNHTCTIREGKGVTFKSSS